MGDLETKLANAEAGRLEALDVAESARDELHGYRLQVFKLERELRLERHEHAETRRLLDASRAMLTQAIEALDVRMLQNARTDAGQGVGSGQCPKSRNCPNSVHSARSLNCLCKVLGGAR